MLSQGIDTSSNSWELDNAINVIKREIRKSPVWQFREEYIDRGILDPFYIIKIRKHEHDKGCDLADQKLFGTKKAELSYVCRTANVSNNKNNYWQVISSKGLMSLLDNFKSMYDKNMLQPPGLRGDLCNPKDKHEGFHKKRFIYEILSPFKNLTAIGPDMYGISPGAVCGTVYDENKEPLDGVIVELVKGDKIINRKTKDGGLFWFSRLSSGDYKISVKDRSSCTVQVIRRDEFGNIKGWVTDGDGYPAEYTDLSFKAPDGEVFKATTDTTGKFTTGPVPAFPVLNTPLSKYPYIMEVPDFMFSITKSVYVKDAIISGTVKDKEGTGMASKTVILKQGGAKLKDSKTDSHGHFRFFNLEGGRYNLEVEGEKIYLTIDSAARVEGNEAKGIVNETRVELITDGKVVAEERIDRDKDFAFDDVAPGGYEVKVKKIDN